MSYELCDGVCVSVSGPLRIAFSIIPTSAISMTVKSTRKIKNVVCTEPTSSLEMAALVGSISWMAHG